MRLTLFHDLPDSSRAAARFAEEDVLRRLHHVDEQARRQGLDSLDPSSDNLIGLGMELQDGRVTKNSYGVFDLAWQFAEHPEWAEQVEREVAEARAAIRRAHQEPVRFLLWVGMGGSAEDKAAYQAAGLLKRGPRLYVLDSTDPAKLKSIVDDMESRANLPLADVLKSTLVIGMALGMTSYEPVVNLRKLAKLYERHGVDGRPNFLYMTLPGSLLDQFGAEQGYQRVPLQLDNGNSTSGRHSSPLTRGSLFPLALGHVGIADWTKGTQLDEEEIATAWRLSAFLSHQACAGRDKVTLLLPRSWAGAAVWTKQDFEESLGKRETFGLKMVIGERVKLANYRAPKDERQDRVFLAIQIKGEAHPEADKIPLLRRAGYPVASITFPNDLLARYMQFMHYTVFGIGYLQDMNFVTQPSVELYKSITARMQQEAAQAGGLERTSAWREFLASPRQTQWRGLVTLHFGALKATETGEGSAPQVYARILRTLAADRAIHYGELTYFGDTRYDPAGRRMRKVLDRAAERVFRTQLRMPADVGEGPGMNHSYHEMIIGRGGALSTVLLSESPVSFAPADYTADYHRTQFLATQMALAERGRPVVALTVANLEEETLAALDEFFRQTAAALKTGAK